MRCSLGGAREEGELWDVQGGLPASCTLYVGKPLMCVSFLVMGFDPVGSGNSPGTELDRLASVFAAGCKSCVCCSFRCPDVSPPPCLLPSARRIAVEVFDVGCFCSNQQQPLGESVMRIQLLNACGWQVGVGVLYGGAWLAGRS